MDVLWWEIIGIILVSLLVGIIVALTAISYYLNKIGLMDEVNQLTELTNDKYDLFQQLIRNQEFINSLAVKDHRAEQLLISNQRMLEEKADEVK